ncbi:F-box protein At5g49610-like [Cucurbita maxima]|uniref:F-box protein At5g49610-like n=1 Tax=Cucurbita maxima TaxID=3661 RepID=A0A6J1ITL2_CUCMA|nr:F-box protein At5g49610-like [Cucurbita maxima]
MGIQDVIKTDVLRFVPAKSLCRFKSVSKDWNQWISSPFLAHQQAIHFTKTSGFFSQSNSQDCFFIPLDPHSHGVPFPSLSFLPESTSIRTTSNGLLCCQSTFQDSIYFICNPATMEWRQLPEPSLLHGHVSAIALAFTLSTFNFESQFQIVCAVPFHSVKAVYFEIYSSRTNTWKISDSQYFYAGDGDLMFKGDGFCIGETVYWETSNGVILGFDLKYEVYGEIQLPLPPGHGAITEIRGEMCYAMVITCNSENDEAGAYSLGIYGGHDMVLKHRFPLDVGSYLGEDFDGEVRVLSCVSDGMAMILVGSNVILYDVEKRKGEIVKKLVDLPDRASAGRFLPYVNSLVRVCPVERMPREDHDLQEVLRNTSELVGFGEVSLCGNKWIGPTI